MGKVVNLRETVVLYYSNMTKSTVVDILLHHPIYYSNMTKSTVVDILLHHPILSIKDISRYQATAEPQAPHI